MSAKSLTALPRKSRGKNECYRMRNEGLIPAVVYSHGEAEAITIQEKEFTSLFKGHISESVIFDLQIEGQSDLMAFVKDYQKDPLTGKVLHLDLFKVTRGEKIKTHVPVELIGTPVGLKVGGILKHGERDLLIHCLPRLLPEKITVEITKMMPGDVIHVSDIEIDPELEILTSMNNVIVAVDKPKVSGTESEGESVEGEEAAAETGEEAGKE